MKIIKGVNKLLFCILYVDIIYLYYYAMHETLQWNTAILLFCLSVVIGVITEVYILLKSHELRAVKIFEMILIWCGLPVVYVFSYKLEWTSEAFNLIMCTIVFIIVMLEVIFRKFAT